jgi:hypothetical protein
MTITTTMTTELEAINVLLEAAGEAPVQSLATTGLYPLDLAKRILDETARIVMAVGWAFNTEDDHELSKDGGGLIAIPETLLKFDANDEYIARFKPVQRGIRLYDAKNRTYVFTENIKGTAVVLLTWADLPQAARHYITVRAARVMQGRTGVSTESARFTAKDEEEALAGMGDLESDTGDHNMLRDSASCAAVLYGY